MQCKFLLLLAISVLAKALPQYEVNYNSNNGTMENKEFAPRFKQPSKLFKEEIKPAGSSIRMKCVTEGNPTPNITWFKNNGPVERSYLKPSYGKWSLALDELSITDNGNYTCLACNDLGCISRTIYLIVPERLFSKPVMTKGPGNLTVEVGETATFSCEFLSDLHPLVFWKFFKTYEELQNSSSNNEYHGEVTTMNDPNEKSERFTIAKVTQDDQGWYMCIAMNALGTSVRKGYLTVLNHDNETKSINISNIKQTGI